MENTIILVLLVILLGVSLLIVGSKNKWLKKQILFFNVLYREDFVRRRSSNTEDANSELLTVAEQLSLSEIQLLKLHFIDYYKTFIPTAPIVAANINAINHIISDENKKSLLLTFVTKALESFNEEQLAHFYVSTFNYGDSNEFSSAYFQRERNLIPELLRDKHTRIFVCKAFKKILKLVEEKTDEDDKALWRAEAIRIRRIYG